MNYSSNKSCPSCGSTDFDYDEARGEYTCSCGRVLAENTQITEVSHPISLHSTNQSNSSSANSLSLIPKLQFTAESHNEQ